jgi:hypothetical protein
VPTARSARSNPIPATQNGSVLACVSQPSPLAGILNELARQCPRPVKPREQAGDRDRSRAAVTRSNASLTIATSGGQRHPEARGPGFEQRQSRRIGPPPVGRTRTRPIGLALRSSSRSSVRRQDRGLHVSAGRACRPRDSLRRAAHPMILRKPLGLFRSSLPPGDGGLEDLNSAPNSVWDDRAFDGLLGCRLASLPPRLTPVRPLQPRLFYNRR